MDGCGIDGLFGDGNVKISGIINATSCNSIKDTVGGDIVGWFGMIGRKLYLHVSFNNNSILI